ncbi:MAG: hypothetical protein ACI3ZA_07730 [Alloprevotella sp.]
MKKLYITPQLTAVPIETEGSLLGSSYIGVGGNTEGFDSNKKEYSEESDFAWEEDGMR